MEILTLIARNEKMDKCMDGWIDVEMDGGAVSR
jgi:hypothetical protein